MTSSTTTYLVTLVAVVFISVQLSSKVSSRSLDGQAVKVDGFETDTNESMFPVDERRSENEREDESFENELPLRRSGAKQRKVLLGDRHKRSVNLVLADNRDKVAHKLQTFYHENRPKLNGRSVDVTTRRRRSIDTDWSQQISGSSWPQLSYRPTGLGRSRLDELRDNLIILEYLRATANKPDVLAELNLSPTNPEVEIPADDAEAVAGLEATLFAEGGDESDATGNSLSADKRVPAFAGVAEVRSPRDIHPVYLGMGQSAASAALNTYASLLADDKRRENDQQISSNPVRFIGKR